MVADPAFLTEAEKLRLTVTPMSGEEVARDDRRALRDAGGRRRQG